MNITERLAQALRDSQVALDDWLNTWASEFCDPERVRQAQERIDEYGTCGYIAHVQQANREALAQYDASASAQEGWRPIKTAKKWLGSNVPEYKIVSDGHYVFIGYKHEPNYPGDPEWCDEHGEFIEPQPTHWMPLPAPPTATASDEVRG